MSKYDFSFKILLIGESGVGKTCLLLRFTDDTFTVNHQTTIGVDFKQKTLLIKDKIIKVQVWDTAGQERFRTLTKSFYKIADGIILTYDVTNVESFISIKNWLRQVDQYADISVLKIIVGNKCDYDEKRVVTFEEGEKFATGYNIPFFETSAKSNVNVSKTFSFLTEILLKKNFNLESNESGKISLQRDDEIMVKNEKSDKCIC